MTTLARAAMAAAFLTALGAGCDSADGPTTLDRQPGALTARPGVPTGSCFSPGLHEIGLGVAREPLVYVPPSHDPARSTPLAVLFHGAYATAEYLEPLHAHADRLGMIFLLMQSQGISWDLMIHAGWGRDRANTDLALEALFGRCRIDPDRIAFVGHSAGASYALTLGRLNGELASQVAVFSPGFELGRSRDPKPRIFIAHGTGDEILDIDVASRPIVARLEAGGYDVTFVEFDGGHALRLDIAEQGFDWLAAGWGGVPVTAGSR